MDICIWNKCNNKCVMCTNPQGFWESDIYDKRFVQDRLKEISKGLKKSDSVLMTGGEPTIHPDFLEIMDFARSLFPHHIDLLSNGRRCAYRSFVREIWKTGNLAIAVPLHGHDAKTHDRITRMPGSFEQACRGIGNLLALRNPALGQEVEIRAVISRFNYKMIDKILKLIAENFGAADRAVLIFIEADGQGKDNFKSIGLTYSQFAPQLKKIAPYAQRLKELRLYHFPLCVLSKELWPNAWRTLDQKELTHSAACQKCAYKKWCLGIPKGYSEIAGVGEFKPPKSGIVIRSGASEYHPILDIK